MTKYIMTTQSRDRTAIVAALTRCLADYDGFITELAQFGTPTSERFYSRIEFRMTPDDLRRFRPAIDQISQSMALNINIIPKARKTKTVLMVSKFDHCLADILYRTKSGTLPLDIAAIVSNHTDAQHHADIAKIPFFHVPVTSGTKADAEKTLRGIIESTKADLIILARYMQILSDDICQAYSGKIINIHHSFLPSFKGAKPYHRAYELGVKLIGATAHYVTADLDEGPIIEQQVKRVDHTMGPKALIAIGRDVETQTLARAVKLHAEHRAFINGNKTVVLP